jgi:hypothetical protein
MVAVAVAVVEIKSEPLLKDHTLKDKENHYCVGAFISDKTSC